MASMITNINNFHPKHRGKVIGILDASFSGGPALFALLYGTVFAKGHTKDEQNQDLKGFYLVSAIAFAATGIVGIIFLKNFPFETPDYDVTTIITDSSFTADSESVSKSQADDSETIPDVTGLQLLKRTDFHFIFWAYIFCAGLQLMFQNNIGVYLKSYHLEKYTTTFTTLNPIAGVLCKFLIGFISDLIVHKVPRITLLLCMNILQTVILTLCIFFSDNFPVLVITLIGIGFSNGALWCLTPAMVSESFGLKYFGRNWGSIIFGNAFGGWGIQYVFGVIYDNSITLKHTTDCFGLHCFTWSFTMAAVLSLCACIFNVGFLQGDIEHRRKRRQSKTSSEMNRIQ